MGIHHQNKYNAYCLADDIMEPYRPYIDEKVHELYSKGITELNTEVKTTFLQMPTYDVYINNKNCTLQHAVTLTTASLYRCYSGETRKILYPETCLLPPIKYPCLGACGLSFFCQRTLCG